MRTSVPTLTYPPITVPVSSESTPARAWAARCHGSIDTRSKHSQKEPSRAPKRRICADGPHAICGPRFPRGIYISVSLSLSSRGGTNARVGNRACLVPARKTIVWLTHRNIFMGRMRPQHSKTMTTAAGAREAGAVWRRARRRRPGVTRLVVSAPSHRPCTYCAAKLRS